MGKVTRGEPKGFTDLAVGVLRPAVIYAVLAVV